MKNLDNAVKSVLEGKDVRESILGAYVTSEQVNEKDDSKDNKKMSKEDLEKMIFSCNEVIKEIENIIKKSGEDEVDPKLLEKELDAKKTELKEYEKELEKLEKPMSKE